MIAFFCSGQIQYFYSRVDTLTWSDHLPAGEDDGKFIIIDEPTGFAARLGKLPCSSQKLGETFQLLL